MRALHPAVKIVFASLIGLAVACAIFAVWQFGIPHRLTTLRLGQHQLRLAIDYHFDISHDVLCELSGPKWQHSAQIIAFIGDGESSPVFEVHQATNRQVFWITADTMPKIILYALDVENGEHWPARELGKDGQKFLEIADSTENGYRLYQHEWIGVKK